MKEENHEFCIVLLDSNAGLARVRSVVNRLDEREGFGRKPVAFHFASAPRLEGIRSTYSFVNPILAVSDVVLTGLYMALTGFLIAGTNVLTHWLASRKVEAVRTALEASDTATNLKLDGIAQTGEKTHTLVNSNMGIQLALHAVTTARLAQITKAPADIEAAKKAKQMLNEHEGKQAVVDANMKTP